MKPSDYKCYYWVSGKRLSYGNMEDFDITISHKTETLTPEQIKIKTLEYLESYSQVKISSISIWDSLGIGGWVKLKV